MEELKRMLEAIHKENKDILFLLCSDGIDDVVNFDTSFKEEIENKYDELFYGKESSNEQWRKNKSFRIKAPS